MRKLVFILMLTTIALLTTRCTLGSRHATKDEIFKLLNSDQPRDLIFGAFDAGESKDTVFLPLLLKNADDPRMCTHIRFKGFSVYQEKMGAIKKILNVTPPTEITHKPDSTVIKFYMHAVSARKR